MEKTSSQDDFNNSVFNKSASSEINAAVVASVISVLSTVVLIIAVTAITCAITNCVKKSRSSISISAKIMSSNNTDNDSNNKVAVDLRRDQFPVAFDSLAEFPTIKGFLSNMAREKPITYSAKQIVEFTHNYSCSNILGSGGFGEVYKGLLENGVQVAVKVLTNNNRAKIVEEQFMVEAGTLGRTYCVNRLKSRLLYVQQSKVHISSIVFRYLN